MGYSLADFAKCSFRTPSEESHFFGYYDKSPIDRSGRRLLSHRVDFDGRDLKTGDTTTVGYWDLENTEYVSLGETAAFNWQQGAMLQWLPPTYDTEVIYNKQDGDSFVSVVMNVDTGEHRVLDRPVYAVHPSGEYALTLNYERLYYCRLGYRYMGVQNPKWDQPVHPDDGIYRVDLESGDTTQLISTKTVSQIDPDPEYDQRDNWLEHMLWNPSGTRFAFFHRVDDPSGGHETRMFTADPDGSNLFMFPDTGFYSHMGWRNDDRFTVWARQPTTVNQAADVVKSNPVLDKLVRPGYRLIRNMFFEGERDKMLSGQAYLDFTDRSRDFSVVGAGKLDRNGHNTWRSDGRWMLTDTYPDKSEKRHLLLWDDKHQRLVELGQFDAMYGLEGYRSDLHPRWDLDEQRIIVDTAHQRRRQMLVIEPDWEALEA